MINQISLFEKSIDIFQSNLQNLTRNQQIINVHIKNIEHILSLVYNICNVSMYQIHRNLYILFYRDGYK